MISHRTEYLGGGIAGFGLGLLAMLAMSPQDNSELLLRSNQWITLNMGSSAWLFGAVLIFWSANLFRLNQLLQQDQTEFEQTEVEKPEFKHIVQLDQLSDVWIHLFVGIGVVWTAVGMRSALSTTLAAPGNLTEGAGEILTRLVDGGILLALTTTIVGAIGGYLMRLGKTMFIGAGLTAYYHAEERTELHSALAHLGRIENRLDQMSGVITVASSASPRSALEVTTTGNGDQGDGKASSQCAT